MGFSNDSIRPIAQLIPVSGERKVIFCIRGTLHQLLNVIAADFLCG